jgi:biopolymer transport protein ExbD
MNFKKRNHRKIGTGSALDLTPVVDVVFNLLIFFALSLNFAAASRGIDVKLPSSSSAQTLKSDQLTINLTKNNKTYLDDKPVSNIDELKKQLKEKADIKSLIVIRADNDVSHGKVVEIMDAVKSAGLNRIAIAVDAAKIEKQTDDDSTN